MADNFENNKSHVSEEFLDQLRKAGLAPHVPYRPDMTANEGPGATRALPLNGWEEWSQLRTSTFPEGKK